MGVIERWDRKPSGSFAQANGWTTQGQSLGIAVSPDKKTLAAGTGQGSREGFMFFAL